jgi:biopolymer transport protein ExbD
MGRLFRNRVDHKLFIRADRDVDYREVALAMDDTRGVDESLKFGLLSHR